MNKRREHEKQQKHTKIHKNQVQKEATGRTSARWLARVKGEGLYWNHAKTLKNNCLFCDVLWSISDVFTSPENKCSPRSSCQNFKSSSLISGIPDHSCHSTRSCPSCVQARLLIPKTVPSFAPHIGNSNIIRLSLFVRWGLHDSTLKWTYTPIVTAAELQETSGNSWNLLGSDRSILGKWVGCPKF